MIVLMRVAEMLYRAINRVRRAMYRAGVLRAKKLPRPVVSVGNIATGGAGKTPAVIAIARFLTERGHRVAVLTRGYGREGEGGIVDRLDAQRFGDEPTVIKSAVDKAVVIVGTNRYDNARQYLRDNDVDIFILDDGFQHLQLHRDFDLIVDAPNARFHREGRSALRYADAVIPRRLRLILPSGMRSGKVFAFSALADNEQFFESLRREDVELVGTLGFPDHHRYTDQELDDVVRRARDRGAAIVVTTEKDAVKIGRRDIIPVRADFIIEPSVLEAIAALLQR